VVRVGAAGTAEAESIGASRFVSLRRKVSEWVGPVLVVGTLTVANSPSASVDRFPLSETDTNTGTLVAIPSFAGKVLGGYGHWI